MEYRIATGWRIASFIFSAALIAGGIAFFLSPGYSQAMHNTPAAAILLGIVSIGAGAALWLGTKKYKITIDGFSISKEGAFKRISLPFDEIAGYRKEKSTMFLVSKTGTRLLIPDNVENARQLKQWVEDKYQDADAAAVEQETKEILADEHFGASEQERLALLLTAKKVTTVFYITSTILCFWLLVYPKPYELLWLAALVMPVAALYFLWRFKGLITVNGDKKSAYPSMLPVFIYSIMLMTARAFIDYTLYTYDKLWQFMIIVAGVLTVVAYQIAYRGVAGKINKKPMLFLLILFFVGYGYSATVFFNCRFDKSAPQVLSAPVIRKYVQSGKSTSYHIITQPWGRFTNSVNLSVSKTMYQSVEPEDTVSIALMMGRLDIPWYFVESKQVSLPPSAR